MENIIVTENDEYILFVNNLTNGTIARYSKMYNSVRIYDQLLTLDVLIFIADNCKGECDNV